MSVDVSVSVAALVNAIATMVLTHAPGVRGFGDVEIDSEGWIRRFRRAPAREPGAPELRPMS